MMIILISAIIDDESNNHILVLGIINYCAKWQSKGVMMRWIINWWECQDNEVNGAKDRDDDENDIDGSRDDDEDGHEEGDDDDEDDVDGSREGGETAVSQD